MAGYSSAKPFETGPWISRLHAARESAKARLLAGRVNLDRYLQKTKRGLREAIVPHDFFYTEQKKAQLFYQVPEFQLKSERPGYDRAAALFAAVLNQKILSAKGVNTQVLLDGMVFDVVCPVGFAACKIGYESKTAEIPDPTWVPPVPTPVPDGLLAGAMNGIKSLFAPTAPPPTPPMIPTVIAEKYFADRIPPGRLLLPPEWLGGDLDEAPWVGFEFWEQATSGQGAGGAMEQETLLSASDVHIPRMENRRRVVEVWKREIFFDDTAHPDRVCYFQWADGEPEPRVIDNSPYQTENPDGTLGGMKGYPIWLLTIRTVSDAALPPSDIQIARHLIDELSVGRTQLLEGRDRGLPQSLINLGKFGDKVKAELEKNITMALIPVEQPIDESDIRAIDKGSIRKENFDFQNYTERDLDRLMGLGANQTGVRGRGAPTATEMQLIQANTDTRLDYERQRILAGLCDKFVPKIAALVQLFHDREDYVSVVGEDGAAELEKYTKADLQGEFSFAVQAGSSLRRDANAERKKWLDLYNIAIRDQGFNGNEIRRNLAKTYGLDPARVLQQPPPPEPEKPRISVSLKVEDFIGLAAEIAKKIYNGEPITDEDLITLQTAQLEQAMHGGPALQAEPIDSHQLDQTARLSGGGAMVAENTVPQ